MRDYVKRGLVILSSVMLIIGFMTTISAAVMSANYYRLKTSTEYMDKTYIFTMRDTTVGTTVNTFCAEHAAPTFDSKRGLMDWIDFRAVDLETKFETDVAGRIRAIIDLAGAQKEKEYLVEYFQEYIGIEEVTYEQIVSAVQYAIWYYSDGITQVPSSENGEDIYKYLISLPPKTSYQNIDIIRINQTEIKRNNDFQRIEISYQYNASGHEAELEHSYSPDIITELGAKEHVVKDSNGLVTVLLHIPIQDVVVDMHFDVIVEGIGELESDVYAFVPDTLGEIQAMVGYTKLNQMIGLSHKSMNISYKAYSLTIENNGTTVISGHSSGEQVSIADVEARNPSGRSGYTFKGWYYKGGSKVSESGIIMDESKYVVAKYNKKSSGGTQTPDPDDDDDDTGNNPDPDDDNDDTGNNPDPDDDDDDTGNNPDPDDDDDDTGNNPDPDDDDDDTGNNPDPDDDNDDNRNNPTSDDDTPDDEADPSFNPDDDTDIIDEDKPEALPEDELSSDDEDIMDEEVPEASLHELENNGNFFYYINRFIRSGGVPFLIFFLLGLLALLIGIYLKQKQVEKEIEDGAHISSSFESDKAAYIRAKVSNKDSNDPFSE